MRDSGERFAPQALGFVFGRVLITSDRLINGDFYLVEPGANFAQGEGLITVRDQCLLEDVRYATGGVFDDTVIFYHYLQLTTVAMGGEDAAIVDVYDESGTLFDSFRLILPDVRNRGDFISVADTLDELFVGAPAFGYFRFFWNPDTVGAGTSFATTSADGRFSVGVRGACRLNVLDVP